MAVSVAVLVFIVIDRSWSEGCGFDSHCRLGSFLIFYSQPIMFGAFDSLVSSGVFGASTWVNFLLELLDFFSKLCTYTRALANQAIHSLGVGKLVPAICRG